MKRDEMIALLVKDSDGKHSENTVKEILFLAEKYGMLPPSVDEDKCQAIMDIYYAGYTFNQWDEDYGKDDKVMAAYKRRMERKNK